MRTGTVKCGSLIAVVVVVFIFVTSLYILSYYCPPCTTQTHTHIFQLPRPFPSHPANCFQEDPVDVGLGIIETPLATTLLGGGDEVAEAVWVLMLAMIAPASLGETVVVLTNELAAPELELEEEEEEEEEEELELDDEELLLLLLPLLLLLLLPPFLRTRTAMSSVSMSIKVSSGPAMIALLCRSMTPPFKG